MRGIQAARQSGYHRISHGVHSKIGSRAQPQFRAVFTQVLLQFIRIQPIGDFTKRHHNEAVAGQEPGFAEDLDTRVPIQSKAPASIAHGQQKPRLPVRRAELIFQPAQSLGDGLQQRPFLSGFGTAGTSILMPLSLFRPSPSTAMM